MTNNERLNLSDGRYIEYRKKNYQLYEPCGKRRVIILIWYNEKKNILDLKYSYYFNNGVGHIRLKKDIEDLRHDIRDILKNRTSDIEKWYKISLNTLKIIVKDIEILYDGIKKIKLRILNKFISPDVLNNIVYGFLD